MKYACILGFCAGIALIVLSPDQTLMQFIGGLLFLGFGLALLVLLVRFVWRSLKSGSKIKGVAVGLGVLLLIAFVVQRVIAQDDTREIKETIEIAYTSSDPSYCEERLTQRFLTQTTGQEAPFADDVCESEAETSGADSVDVRNIVVDGDRARAVVAPSGGFFDGSVLVEQLVKEDGDWKLDQIAGFARFDRAKFDHAYRASVLEFGSPTRSADCVVAKLRRYSDAEIKRAGLQDSRRPFDQIFVECDRQGTERNLRTGIANSEVDPPPEAIACAQREIAAATDAELVRLQNDLVAYGMLALNCDREAVFDYYERELSSEYELDSDAADFVVDTFKDLPPARFIRLSYDDERYDALIEDCEH